jgi:hypothetical protein
LGKELGQIDKAIEYFETACHMFREHGTPDTAALCLDRGAKMIENKNPEKAAAFYTQATDVSMIENKPHQAAEFAGKAARMNLKLKKLDEASDMINKQMVYLVEAESDRSCGRIVVCQVIIQLARNDGVAAQKAFNDGQNYVESQEHQILHALLEGVNESDAKKIIATLNHPFIKSLDNEFAKLARDVAVRYEEAAAQQADETEAGGDGQAGAML